jgi:hypothetical protein
MELHNLPDLSHWLYIEVWTIEEAAMLWGAIDPMEHKNIRLQELECAMEKVQHKKAWACQRAISEAVCGGTLPFVEALKECSDYNNNEWTEKIEFPNLPEHGSIIPHMTRINQAAFRKWAGDKKILSYRQQFQKLRPIQKIIDIELPVNTDNNSGQILALAAPAYLDPGNPLSPEELRAAHDAWKAVTERGNPKENGAAVKAAIIDFLNNHATYRSLSNGAKLRISIVANFDKKGGPPKTPG